MAAPAPADPELRLEAERFARYLVGAAPSDEIAERYARAVRRDPPAAGARDARLVDFARRRPWSIPLLDAALALRDPHAELRRRLYLMFAILESTPEHHDRFLPAARRPAYVLRIAAVGARAVLRAAGGVVLLAAVGRAR
jgi:hypothetical protein